MKEISHPRLDFDTYVLRPETRCVMREAGDSLQQLYALGYLPYSGARELHNIFYDARSARIVVPRFELTSENRRIAKKFDGQFTKKRVPIANFKVDEAFVTFCLGYFAQKHGARAMPRERLETIMHSGLITTVVIYQSGARTAAYVLEVREGSIGHYWFSFYDLAYARQSLGLWLMLDCLREAKASGLAYYYLGTVYGEKALYKTNFEPLEWWDGTGWSGDRGLLKERSRSDNERMISHTDAQKAGVQHL